MKRNAQLAAVICILAGVLLLLNCMGMAHGAVSRWLEYHGGYHEEYVMAMLTGYAEAYRIAGAMLLGAGLLAGFTQAREK